MKKVKESYRGFFEGNTVYVSVNYVLKEIARQYAEAYKGSGMTVEEAFEEIICDAEAGMNVFEEARKSAEEVRQYGEVLDETKQAAEESKPIAPTTGANAAEKFSGKIKNDNYDYSKSFAEQIDDLKSGTFPRNDTLIMGGTPEVFKNIGLLPLPMTYTQQHAKEAIKNADGDHLGEELLKRVLKALETPIAIIDSETVPGRIVAILGLKNGNNNAIAAVEIEGTGRMHGKIIDSNLVVSAYSRENTISKLLKNALVSEINNNRGIYYWDKKRTTNLVSVIGVQFPAVSSISDGYVHSITEFSKNVNGLLKNIFDTKQFKRWFGKSKVVNKDGTPKVMYHGSNKEFTVFKREMLRDRMGFFFTSSIKEARQYGTPKPYYLSIQNPIDIDSDVISKYSNIEDADKLIKALKNDGYDGLYHKSGGNEWFVAFDSTQIKSATNNIGTFDGSNPDIRF